MSKPNPMGSTFAERAAARAGESKFEDPTPDRNKRVENTSFAERGGKPSSKAVDAEDDGAENKAVAKKAAAKKS